MHKLKGGVWEGMVLVAGGRGEDGGTGFGFPPCRAKGAHQIKPRNSA